MQAIRVLRNTSASGVSLTQGKIYKVPSEISEKDATTLVMMRKAKVVNIEEDKKEKEIRKNVRAS